MAFSYVDLGPGTYSVFGEENLKTMFTLAKIFQAIFLISVPVMLCTKPCIAFFHKPVHEEDQAVEFADLSQDRPSTAINDNTVEKISTERLMVKS